MSDDAIVTDRTADGAARPPIAQRFPRWLDGLIG